MKKYLKLGTVAILFIAKCCTAAVNEEKSDSTLAAASAQHVKIDQNHLSASQTPSSETSQRNILMDLNKYVTSNNLNGFLELIDVGKILITHRDINAKYLDLSAEFKHSKLVASKVTNAMLDQMFIFFPKIEIIDLSNNEFIGPMSFNYFSTSSCLVSLNLSNCPDITDEVINRFSMCENLSVIKLSECSLLTNNSIVYISKLTKLRALNMNGCVGISDISPLSTLHNLEFLSLQSCSQIVDWSVLSSFINLFALDIRDCDELENINLSNYKKLKALYIKLMPSNEDDVLNLIEKAVGLKMLNIVGDVQEVTDLSFLEKSIELEYLRFESIFIKPHFFKTLKNLSKLKKVIFDETMIYDEDLWKIIEKKSNMKHKVSGKLNYLVRKK